MLEKRLRMMAAVGVAAVAGLGLTACGGGTPASGADAGGGIAKEIKLAAVHDMTGLAGFAGTGADQGARLAIDEINSSAFLGEGVKISMDTTDSAGSVDQAVSGMATALRDPQVAAILGPTAGQQAAAVAPAVDQQKVPTVFTQSGASGVVTGPYTFRVTPPMQTYYAAAMDYLKDQGAKKIAVIYNATYTTFAELGGKVVPELASERGMTVGPSVEVQSTTQDFAGQAQQIASARPDAVVNAIANEQTVTFLTQLRQAGYTGQVVATSVQAAGKVSAANAAADGLVYPVTFSTVSEQKTSQDFTAAFEKEYGGTEPDVYAADGYDAIWWIARGIKASGDSSREGIREGLSQVGKEGFAGAQGDLTFDGGNDARVPGLLVQWKSGAESLVQ
jgi:branched-chain amino acid transport system substrate-binding protein